MHYGGQAPDWAGILLAAEEWGCPPWVVEEGPAVWYQRWLFYNQQRNKAVKSGR